MKIRCEKSGRQNQLAAMISDMLSEDKSNGIMILACDKNGFTPESIDPLLKSIPVPVFGGIFPQIIYENVKLTEGTIVAVFEERPSVTVIPQLSDEKADYESMILKNFPIDETVKTMLLFVDGMAARISALVEALFISFGLDINYIGGGAGSLSFEKKPCLFTNEGLIADSALLVGTGISSGVGVKHGWGKIHSGLTVTKSEKNRIISLNWKPAYTVYKDIVEQHSGMKFKDDNFFNISKRYPFGIKKIGTEYVVRDPLMEGNDSSLICVGEVPSNSVVDILTGDKTSLIAATTEALRTAIENFPIQQKSMKTIFFVDCISRVLFLEDTFQEELDAVYNPDITMIGILTLGELANSGHDYLEFYNKTAVVAVMDH